MSKKFRIEKAFGEQWVVALRSGEYKQGNGELYQVVEVALDEKEERYCCLGVACAMKGVSLDDIESKAWPSEALRGEDRTLISALLIGSDEDASYFQETVAVMNDGLTGWELQKHQEKGLIFRDEHLVLDEHTYQFSFEAIADFIEDNVEFV